MDAPQLYREAMRRDDADGWVEAVAEEYQNLCWKGVFVEVEVPQMHMYMRVIWCSQRKSDLKEKSQERRFD